MKNRNIILGYLFLVFLLISCEGLLPCLEGDGNIKTQDRFGGAFTSVQNEGEFKVRIEYAETTSVEVTTDENLLNNIETVVQNGKLIIQSDHDGCINFSPQTEVVIKCPNLSNVIQQGSGNLEVYNFKETNFLVVQAGSGNITVSSLTLSEDIEVNLIGSGNVWLKGKALNAMYVLSGSGNIDSEAMRVSNCNANLSGSGNIHTYVYEILKVTLTGSGSVYYYGNTKEVNEHITGSGSVVNRSFSSAN